MKIQQQIVVKHVCKIGQSQPRNVLITLASIKDKGAIFKHAKNLKDMRNNDDKPYFINDHLTLGLQERNRKWRSIVRVNCATPDNDRMVCEWKKGELYVNQQPYQDPINPPSIERITSGKENLDHVKLTKGEMQTHEGCRFIGYSIEIRSLEDIRQAYLKIYRTHPAALYVMCAYRLPGTEIHQLQNYCDDREDGGSRVLYQLLCNSDIMHRAIFVVRYYGNKHLGPLRFHCIIGAAKSAIARSTMNSILGVNQFVSDTPNRQNARVSKPIRGGHPPRGRTPGSSRPFSSFAKRWSDVASGGAANLEQDAPTG